MKVLMVASEMVPFAKTGGLADVTGALPLALAGLGVEVAAIIPCYRGTKDRIEHEPTGVEVVVPVARGDHYIDKRGRILKSRLEGKVDVYLVEMDEYFDREHIYTDGDKDYADNCARYTFFCRAAVELVRSKTFVPDVIHCHDWQAALVPIYRDTILEDEPPFPDIAAITTIHNLGYPGIFWHWDMKVIGVPWEYFNAGFLEYHGKINLLKGALIASDAITTVSEGYAREIATPEYGYGMDGIIGDRSDDLYGIVNGIDYDIWDPATDKRLAANYSPSKLAGKAACKAALQKELGLPQRPDVPLVGSISRLIDAKGFDLVTALLDELMEKDIQLVILGAGSKKYGEIFTNAARKFPEKMSANIGYDEALAHRIEAGADIFLMPSRYEPCGLNQLISLKYGTVPVVRATGGLDDTVSHYDPKKDGGNGFKFERYRSDDLMECVEEALNVYANKAAWRELMLRGMREDHSWDSSARRYLALYRRYRKNGKGGGA